MSGRKRGKTEMNIIEAEPRKDINQKNFHTDTTPQLITLDSDTPFVNEITFSQSSILGRYKIIGSLGSGSSGSVKLGICIENQEKVAIKIVERKANKNSNEPKEKYEERIFREIIISSLLNHPNIARLKNFYYNSNYFYLIFEYINGKQLYDIVLKEGPLQEKDARRYFRQVLSAVSYIHENNIVHRDLKIENILVDENGNIKILDFGLSNFFDKKRFLSTFCGSLYFAAPELLSGNGYMGPEVDIWSLGVILYVMVIGTVPFDDDEINTLHSKIKKGNFNIPKNHIGKDCKRLLTRMICVNPIERIDLFNVINSNWVKKSYKTDVQNYLPDREPIVKQDDRIILLINILLRQQFSQLYEDFKNEQENKSIIRKSARINIIKTPMHSIYYLINENIDFQNWHKKDSEKAIVNKIEGNQTKISDNLKTEEMLHRFVNLLFVKEKNNYFSKYFFGGIYQLEDNKRTNHPKDINSIKSKTKNHLSKYKSQDDSMPKIKKSIIRGLYKGILMSKLENKDILRDLVIEFFNANRIFFQVTEKYYKCLCGEENNVCIFKVSLYLNPLRKTYFLSITRLEGSKGVYNKILQLFEIFGENWQNEGIHAVN